MDLSHMDSAPEPDLHELLERVRSSKAGGRKEDIGTEIVPEPGFVVKTVESSGRKVFINVCGSSSVPAPGDWSGGEVPKNVKEALQNIEGLPESELSALRFPLSLGPTVTEEDKKGEPCYTLDCVVNLDILKQTELHRPLKSFLIQLVLDWITEKRKLELDRRYKLPRMRYKGGNVRHQRIRMEKKDTLIEEIIQDDSEPTFPLRTSKAAKEKKRASIASKKGTQQSIMPLIETESKITAKLGKEPLTYSVDFVGCPVHEVVISVQVPESGRILAESDLNVEIRASTVQITVSKFQPLLITLPFAVDAHQAVASVEDGKQLKLKLAYRPLQEVAAELRRNAPHTPNELQLLNKSYIELEA